MTAAHSPHAPQGEAHVHSTWNDKFTEQDRKKLLHEDLVAAENTLAVLLTIVTFGVLLGIVGVLLCVWIT